MRERERKNHYIQIRKHRKNFKIVRTASTCRQVARFLRHVNERDALEKLFNQGKRI